MNKYDIFITEYNKLENLISELPTAPPDAKVKWLEDTLDDNQIKNKLYLCRITRNYIQHNTDYETFLNITDDMIDFIKNTYKLVYSQLVTIEEYMIPVKKCCIRNVEDNILETVKIMNNKDFDFVPIIENNFVKGIFSKDTILELFVEGKITNKSTFKDINEKLLKIDKDEIKFIKKDVLLENVISLFKISKTKKKMLKLILVTDTGNSKGNILGLMSEYDIL